MKISYPFNVTNQTDGSVLPQTRAFHNQHAAGYDAELAECQHLNVPRVCKSDLDAFVELVDSRGPIGVKWAYTVYRELFIVPQMWGSYEPPHAYAASGLPVFCAGFARKEGDNLTVDNWTGHYQVPSARAITDIQEAFSGLPYTIVIGTLLNPT